MFAARITIFIVVWLMCSENVTADRNHDISNQGVGSTKTSLVEKCNLPSAWHGTWFQASNSKLVRISKFNITGHGQCMKTSPGSPVGYILKSKTRSHRICWKCMFFDQKHKNLIQYKQTFCDPKSSPETICRNLYGDTPVIYLFRHEAKPRPCPVVGPFEYSYTEGFSSCEKYKSHGDACSRDSQLRLRYEACLESQNPQLVARTEQIECYGSWTDSRKRFFSGRLLPSKESPRQSDKEQYRCFMYDMNEKSGTLGISADAKCQEMTNWESVNSKIHFKRHYLPEPRCRFAHSLRTAHNKRGSTLKWESLDIRSALTYRFEPDTIIAENLADGEPDATYRCIDKHETHDRAHQYTVFTVNGCENNYQCLRIFRRDSLHADHVLEIQRGKMTPHRHLACSPEFMDPNTAEYETLLLTTAQPKECPQRGHFVQLCGLEAATLSFGCDQTSRFVVDFRCDDPYTEVYSCYAYWGDPKLNYLVAKDEHTGRKACFVYSMDESGMSVSTFYEHSCRRGIIPGYNGHRVYNTTVSHKLCSPSFARHNQADGLRIHSAFTSIILMISFALVSLFTYPL